MSSFSLMSLFGVDQTTDDKHHFETSWVLSPALLAGLRGLTALYIFLSIFIFWGWYGTHHDLLSIGRSFSSFTWLTYWGLGFYMLFAAIHTAFYARTGRSVLFDRWPRIFRVLHSLLYVTITTFPFLVTVVFCTVIFTPPWYKETFSAWQNVSQHGLNSLFALLEIILPATPPHPFIAIPFLLLMLLQYLCVVYITHEAQGWYPYAFLNAGEHGQNNTLVIVYCFAIMAAVLAAFGVSWELIRLRCRLTHGKIKRARRDPLRPHDVAGARGEESNEMTGAIGLGELMGRFASSGGIL